MQIVVVEARWRRHVPRGTPGRCRRHSTERTTESGGPPCNAALGCRTRLILGLWSLLSSRLAALRAAIGCRARSESAVRVEPARGTERPICRRPTRRSGSAAIASLHRFSSRARRHLRTWRAVSVVLPPPGGVECHATLMPHPSDLRLIFRPLSRSQRTLGCGRRCSRTH